MAQDCFLPDMNSMEEQDKDALKEDQQLAGEVFDQLYSNGKTASDTPVKPEILQEAKHYLGVYEQKIADNQKQIKKRLVTDLSSIYTEYLKLLFLLIAIEKEIEAAKRKKNIGHNNFANNAVIQGLKKSEQFEADCARHNVGWDADTLRTWYKEYIRKAEFYEFYDGLEKARFEDDLTFAQAFYKEAIFKHPDIEEYFESLDMAWSENKTILKSMVLKTIKSIESPEDVPQLMELSKNWDEDLDFLKELYDLTIDNEEVNESRIKKKSKNWEIDRLPTTDKIILEMAIAEMTHFPSIPVKVTINEYIELSKLYSTPKSKQYVNGLLDVLSLDLQKEGLIKKSGRGLLDNK